MTCIVTGLFGRRREVDLVIEHLVQEFEVPREQVQVHAANAEAEEARSTQDDAHGSSLLDLGLPKEVARDYQDGMCRGSILVAAWVDDAHRDRALAAYTEYGAQATDVREAELPVTEGSDTEERIRMRAYLLWEQEGRPNGRERDHWHRARQSVAETGR